MLNPNKRVIRIKANYSKIVLKVYKNATLYIIKSN